MNLDEACKKLHIDNIPSDIFYNSSTYKLAGVSIELPEGILWHGAGVFTIDGCQEPAAAQIAFLQAAISPLGFKLIQIVPDANNSSCMVVFE